MKKLLNTLYILTPDSYLFFRNETICVRVGGEDKVSVPAISIESIVCFSQVTVSTPLIGFCGERGIGLVFLSPHGRFLGRVMGPAPQKTVCHFGRCRFLSRFCQDTAAGKNPE